MPSIVFAGFAHGRGHGFIDEHIHNVPGVTADSHIYAAIAEVQTGGDVDGIRFMGKATMTVHQIIPQPPQEGERLPGVEVRVHVDFEEDLDFRIDLIVVDDR